MIAKSNINIIKNFDVELQFEVSPAEYKLVGAVIKDKYTKVVFTIDVTGKVISIIVPARAENNLIGRIRYPAEDMEEVYETLKEAIYRYENNLWGNGISEEREPVVNPRTLEDITG